MSIKEIFREKWNETPFLILISFLLSFSIARLYVFILGEMGAASRIFPLERYILHHLYYGVALLIVAGWISINYKNKNLHRTAAVLYGAGLGIFFDELGLILTEFGSYWDSITYTISVVAILILLNIVFFSDFWKEVSSDLYAFVESGNLQRGPWSALNILKVADRTSEKIEKTKSITTAFAGVILIVSGFLILRYPQLIYYWVAAAFILSGIAYILQAMKNV